jgi:hypothetical protein
LSETDLAPAADEFLMLVADDGTTQIHVQVTDPYGNDVRVINELLGNSHQEGEFEPIASIRKLWILQVERNRTRLRQSERGEGARDGQG